MTNKTARHEMLQAREAIAAALDAKLGDMPEWRTLRHLDSALLALDPEPVVKMIGPLRVRQRERLNGAHPSYMSLADQALAAAGKPITTVGIVSYIGKHRPLSGDPDKAKIVIQSSLSKDKRFRSVPWEGGRAWWFADKDVPK